MTGRYTVDIARRAIKAIAALPRRDQQRVRAAIDLLADTPRPPGCIAMSGEPHAYRVRVGVYRILYEVLDARLLVHVVRVGHRRDVKPARCRSQGVVLEAPLRGQGGS